MNGDQAMRAHSATLPGPVFDDPAWVTPKSLSESTVAIVTSAALFAGNQRPAVDIGLSVSRVGGKAQAGALRSVAGRVRLDYAQYLEMKMFSRFGGFGDAAMKKRLQHGERIGALLAQERFAPISILAQIALLAALAEGMLDALPVEQFPALKAALPAALGAEPALANLDVTADVIDKASRKILLGCVRAAMTPAQTASKDSSA